MEVTHKSIKMELWDRYEVVADDGGSPLIWDKTLDVSEMYTHLTSNVGHVKGEDQLVELNVAFHVFEMFRLIFSNPMECDTLATMGCTLINTDAYRPVFDTIQSYAAISEYDTCAVKMIFDVEGVYLAVVVAYVESMNHTTLSWEDGNKSFSEESKAALLEVIKYLHQLTEIHSKTPKLGNTAV